MKRIFQQTLFTSALTLATMSFLVGCGGGGGGGETPRSPFITYTNLSPAASATEVDANTSEIKVTFSSDINPASFVNEGTAIMNLFSAKKGKANSNGTVISNLLDGANNVISDFSKVTLAKLSSGYQIVGTFLKNQNGQISPVNGQIKISGYEFTPEEGTGLSSLNIYVEDGAAPFVFSSADLIASGLVNSDIFKVEKLNVSGAATKLLGQVTVEANKVKFKPLSFLDWGSEYRVTIRKNSGTTPDTQGILELEADAEKVRTLENNIVYSFKTKALQDAQVISAAPVGIDANPTAQLTATTNFKVNVSSLANNVKLYRKIKEGNDPSAQVKLVQVEASISYNTVNSQIIITPNGDLRYLQDYKVVITGGSNGISGSQANVTGRTLAQDFTWEFITAEAKVDSIVASDSTPVSEDGVPTFFTVNLNFRPDSEDKNNIPNGVELTEVLNNGESKLTYSYEVKNTVLKIKPSQSLKYGATYKILVNEKLISAKLTGSENVYENFTVHLMTSVSQTFLMEKPKLNTYSPLANTINEKEKITLKFNFDVPDNLTSVIQVIETKSDLSTKTAEVTMLRSLSKRTVEITPNTQYGFGSKLNIVFKFPEVDGIKPIANSIEKNIADSYTFSVTSNEPYSNEINVELDSSLYVNFSHPLKSLTSSQKITGTNDSAIRVFSQYSSTYPTACDTRELTGRITWDTNRVYFVADYGLKAWCKYKVIVNKNLTSEDNRKQQSEYVYYFTMGGLTVQNVYVTYSSGYEVDVTQPIEIVFNKQLKYSQWSDVVKLYNHTRNVWVSGSSYVSGNKISFYPYSNLEYGSQYSIVAYSGYYGVNGTLGESLYQDYSVSFDTEYLPVDVYNYGPVGYVNTDAEYFVEFYQNVNTQGFPYVQAQFGGYNQIVNNDNYYTFSFYPGKASAGYERLVQFWWGSTTDKQISWYVSPVESTLSAPVGILSANSKLKKMKTSSKVFSKGYISANYLSRPSKSTGKDLFSTSCMQSKSCIGMLKTHNNSDYRQKTLRGKQKGDIFGSEAKVTPRKSSK